MEKSVAEVYHSGILNRFLHAYGLDEAYKLLGDFENYVYEVLRNDTPYILRVTHSSHRTEEEIMGEIDWVNYLYANGANVSVTFPSINNQLIEKQIAEDGTIFYACLFSKVVGKQVKSTDTIYEKRLFQSWGKEIGKLHRLTSQYKPKRMTRKQWYEDDLFAIDQYIPAEETLVITRTMEIIEHVKNLPKKHYGLIHNDVHSGNFFYDGKEIYIFDFDDACYFWHVSDIAIPLYYSCYSLFPDESNEQAKQEFANRFLTAFMEGYRTEIEPPEGWETLIPLFLKVRDILLYTALNKKIAPQDRSDVLKRRMQQMKDRIEQQKAIVGNE
ncbi:phosphotransferase enzyme family protein [Ornithinibacillus contaminans]|uniref:phosphotransferase enzyme family protein n=1 Tax=Ornithinibacillus contaminans TaxID=694055 RepID=UPI00064DBCB2|nr:phosphotransferase [Ornithinibacillus contaminans]